MVRLCLLLWALKAGSFTGVFPRGVGQVMKVRKQISAYVAGQLAACTEADPAHPDKPFKVPSSC